MGSQARKFYCRIDADDYTQSAIYGKQKEMRNGERKKELDSWGDKVPRSFTQNARSEAGRKNSYSKAKKSRAFQKPKDTEKSSASRNAQKTPQKVELFAPVRRELIKMLRCLDVLEREAFAVGRTDHQLLLDYLDLLKWQCEIYLKYTMFKR